MGTRHLMIIQHEGKQPIANYGQWDGYPSGQGANILRYVRGESKPNRDGIPVVNYDKAALIEGLKHVKNATEDDMVQVMKDLRIKVDKDGSAWMNMEEAARFNEAHPGLSRDTGTDILKLVQTATAKKPLMVRNNLDFAGDHLFCEFVWVLDLDTDTVEMYKAWPGVPLASYSTLTPPSEEDFLLIFEAADENAEEGSE